MKTPHHPQCGDCSGERFRSGECDGLIAVGEEGGITVYKPCAARISVEEARATAIRFRWFIAISRARSDQRT